MLAVCRNQIEVTTASGSDAMTYYNAARNLRKYHLLTHDRDSSMYEGLTEAVPTESIAPVTTPPGQFLTGESATTH